VLPSGALVFSASLGLLMWSVETGRDPLLTHGFAVLAGASLPVVGSAVRARWSGLVPDKRLLLTAFAYEAVMDEVVFIVGPTVVTLLATAVHPLAGLGTALATGLVGTLLLAAQRRTEPPPRTLAEDRRSRARLPWRTLLATVVTSAALGSVFGSVEVATVAYSEALGVTSAAGPLLGTWAFGSLVSGVVTGAVSWRTDVATRLAWGAAALSVSVLPLPFLGGFPAMVGVLFVAGFAISPTLIALTGLTEQVVPPARLTEGMALVSTGIGAGVAPGAALAGQVIDRAGTSPAYWVAVGSGLVGLVAAFIAATSARPLLAASAGAAGTTGPSGSSASPPSPQP
jgi:hypothetical protein